MSSEENRAIIHRIFEDVWTRGNVDVIDEVFATDYGGDKDITLEGTSRNAKAKQLITMYRTAFPDAHFTIEDMVAEGEQVVVWWTVRGTHKEKYLNSAPTGQLNMITGVSVYLFVGGKIVDVWMLGAAIRSETK
jgi:steroid delta-isomerase-like uncharacterized protein